MPVLLVPAPQTARVPAPDPEVVYSGERFLGNWLALTMPWAWLVTEHCRAPDALRTMLRRTWGQHVQHTVPHRNPQEFRLYAVDDTTPHHDYRYVATASWASRDGVPWIREWSAAWLDAVAAAATAPPTATSGLELPAAWVRQYVGTTAPTGDVWVRTFPPLRDPEVL